MNKGHVSLLVLLDLSAVFDTVDHEILMHRLQTEFGLGGAVLSWFVSYVNHRSQRVSVNGIKSDVLDLSSRGLQGPCLGPLVFLVYASNIFSVIRSRLPPVHAYADDTQLYLSFFAITIDDQTSSLSAMEHCISDIRSWINHDKLKLKHENLNSFSLVHVNN